MGQYLEKTRQDTYTLLKRNISSHLKGLRVVILSRKLARIVYITENLKQKVSSRRLSTRFRWGSLGVCSLVPGLLWQRSSKLKTPKIAVFLLKPKITRNMNYIAAELPNHWNSQTSEVPSAIYTTKERNLSNNRSVNPPIKIFGNTVEKQKKH